MFDNICEIFKHYFRIKNIFLSWYVFKVVPHFKEDKNLTTCTQWDHDREIVQRIRCTVGNIFSENTIPHREVIFPKFKTGCF